MGKEVKQFVAKDGGAAWFEDDYRDAAGDLGGEDVQNPAQQTFCAIEEAEVVEGTSATKICFWQLDAEARRLRGRSPRPGQWQDESSY